MGNGKHLKWVLNDAIDIVYFNCEKEAQYLSSASSLSFYCKLRINSFMGRKKLIFCCGGFLTVQFCFFDIIDTYLQEANLWIIKNILLMS